MVFRLSTCTPTPRPPVPDVAAAEGWVVEPLGGVGAAGEGDAGGAGGGGGGGGGVGGGVDAAVVIAPASGGAKGESGRLAAAAPHAGWSLLMQRAWSEEPTDRPSFDKVVWELEEMLAELEVGMRNRLL